MTTIAKRNYRTIDNLFDEFFSLPSVLGRDNNWNVPPVNIHENKDGFYVELAAPGLRKEDFKVSLDKGLLTISYEKKIENENDNEYKTHRREFTLTNFKRSFTVDDVMNSENIQAKYEDGVLKIYLPKKEEVKVLPKEINIQ